MMHVDDEGFKKEVIDFTGIVIVDFWAEWCSPCRMFGPIFEKTAGDYSDHTGLKFIKVDVDKARNTASEYQVMSIPTVVVFKNGKSIDQNVGVLNEKAFREFIGRYV